jgi:hypothetical protein
MHVHAHGLVIIGVATGWPCVAVESAAGCMLLRTSVWAYGVLVSRGDMPLR